MGTGSEQRSAAPLFEIGLWQVTMQGGRAESVTLAKPHKAVACLAEFGRVLQHGLKYRLKFAGRTADDLEDISGGGLLLKRFASISFSSRVFSMAMTAWAAKFDSNSTCLLVNGRTS